MGATDIIVADEKTLLKNNGTDKGRGADYVVEVTGNPDAITPPLIPKRLRSFDRSRKRIRGKTPTLSHGTLSE